MLMIASALTQVTYIDNYHSNANKEYLDIIKTIQDYKTKILNDAKADDKGFFYNEDKNEIHLKYKKVEVKITKPVYKNVEHELVKLKNENPDKLKEYRRRAYLKRKEKLQKEKDENI